jgi:hypothetical protein
MVCGCAAGAIFTVLSKANVHTHIDLPLLVLVQFGLNAEGVHISQPHFKLNQYHHFKLNQYPSFPHLVCCCSLVLVLLAQHKTTHPISHSSSDIQEHAGPTTSLGIALRVHQGRKLAQTRVGCGGGNARMCETVWNR